MRMLIFKVRYCLRIAIKAFKLSWVCIEEDDGLEASTTMSGFGVVGSVLVVAVGKPAWQLHQILLEGLTFDQGKAGADGT